MKDALQGASNLGFMEKADNSLEGKMDIKK